MAKPALRIVPSEESGLGKPLLIPLSKIHPMEGQPRRYFDPVETKELADNISDVGQETPVKVCRHPTKPGEWELIGGERRWRAFGIIRDKTGTDPLVKALIEELEDHRQQFRKAFTDNLHRKDLVPIDEAAGYHWLQTEDKMTIAAIARLVGKSVSHVDGYLRMHYLADDVKQMMDPAVPKERRLSVTTAIDIARSITEHKLQISVAKESLERELGVMDTRMLIQVKLGRQEMGPGGRLRKASDDYVMLRGFIHRTAATGARIQNHFNMDSLYTSRPDADGDRNRDAEELRHAARLLENLANRIKKLKN